MTLRNLFKILFTYFARLFHGLTSNRNKKKQGILNTMVLGDNSFGMEGTNKSINHSAPCAKSINLHQETSLFPQQILTSSIKPLSLLGQRIMDIGKSFNNRIIYAAYGVYMDPEVLKHLKQNCKVKAGHEIAQYNALLDTLISARVEKYVRVKIIAGIEGSRFITRLRYAAYMGLGFFADEKQNKEVEKLTEFFNDKYLGENSIVAYHFPPNSGIVEVVFAGLGYKEEKITVENAEVAEMILRWYLGGTVGVSPIIITSMASTISEELSK